MLLAVDIGNTNITLGVFDKPSLPLFSWRLSTPPESTADEIGIKILDLLRYSKISQKKIRALAVASVVPKLTPVFEEISFDYFKVKPFVIDENASIPILNLYENPKEVGADRLVNSAAAHAKFGGPVLIVDFGTATTFDCVTKKAEYLGGVIVPGPILSSESLTLHTARLPKVMIEKPRRVIGRNTVESIQSGLYYGYVALIDGLIKRLKMDLGSDTKLAATGGLASLIAPDSQFIRKELIFPHLTLEGIRLIWERNKK